jgi:hypothetical protein
VGRAIEQEDRAVVDDGRHVLQPRLHLGVSDCRGTEAPAEQLPVLHNEGGRPAASYPMKLSEGSYFSEVVGPMNDRAAAYHTLVSDCMDTIRKRMVGGVISFADLCVAGQEMQELDDAFARQIISTGLDAIHRCCGPDRQHPYAKITIARSAFPVNLSENIVWFYFEKFLVSYCYLDMDNKSRSTKTPVHSHPLNFETVYFTSYGTGAAVHEREYHVVDHDGVRLVDDAGNVHPDLLARLMSNDSSAWRVLPGEVHVIEASPTPIRLPPFEEERAMFGHEAALVAFDGLYRPHQVSVIDSVERPTRYFALDNYFGPTCRVFIYNDGDIDLWSHNKWGGQAQK